MVTVIFLAGILLGFTGMALRFARHQRLHRVKLREAPVCRRPARRRQD
jgi:hypothetical protein